MKLLKRTLLVTAASAAATLASSGLVVAQPSEYFLWKQVMSDRVVCEVAAPDPTYKVMDGPFEDPNCKYKIKQ